MSEIETQLIERQQRLEAESVERGVDRYRRAVAGMDPGDTSPGFLATREVMETLSPAIKEAQAQALALLVRPTKGGPKSSWWWTLPFLKPDVLAFITIRNILTAAPGRGRSGAIGRRYASLAICLGGGVEREMEFEQWKRTERDKHKGDPRHVDLARIMVAKVGQVDEQIFRRWRKKLEQIERLGWKLNQKVQLGDKLLTLAVEYGRGWFRDEIYYEGAKTIRRISLSDEAQAAIQDIHARLEVNRPVLLPMVHPPIPWKKVEV
jgi:DNA-directed RNA polymerase